MSSRNTQLANGTLTETADEKSLTYCSFQAIVVSPTHREFTVFHLFSLAYDSSLVSFLEYR